MFKNIFAWQKIYIYIFFIIFYAPIIYILFSSFIDQNNLTFSLYIKLFKNKEIIISIFNSLVIALISSVVSVILGVSGAIGIFFMKDSKFKKIVESIIKMQIANVEIVMAISLSILFIFLRIFFIKFSFITLLIGHICLTLPFVYFFIKPKLSKLDISLYEASLDLGCTQMTAIKEVIIPHILPDIFSSFMFSIMLSLDDFVLTFFLRGPGLFSGYRNIETLSTFVQAKVKKSPIPPELKALAGMYCLLVFIILLLFFLIRYKKRKLYV